MLGLINNRCNLNSNDSRSVKTSEQLGGIIGVRKYKKTAGGLRIEQNVLYFRWDRICNMNALSEKVAIGCKPTCTKTGSAVFYCACQDWDFSMVQLNGNVTGFRNLGRVPDKAEAGDVGHGINSEVQADFRCSPIEFKHHVHGSLNVFG